MHGGEDISLSLSFRLVGSISVIVGHKNQFMIDLSVGESGEWVGKRGKPPPINYTSIKLQEALGQPRGEHSGHAVYFKQYDSGLIRNR